MEKWQDPKIIALWIAIILLLIFTLVFFVVKIIHLGYKRISEANLREAQMQIEHQKKLLETSLQAQEKERTRIAADLHDGLIGKLTVVRLKNQVGKTEDLDKMLEESITEARRISHDLTPPLLEFTSIEELIDNLLDPWRAKMEIILHSDVRTASNPEPHVKIQVVRLVQELLNNIIKHAQATVVTVYLRHTENSFTLCVKDNGRGFDTAKLAQGLGMHNLELRAQYINARYKIKSGVGKGTTTIFSGTSI
jgi:signal transduction histidine kinase